MQTFIAIVLCGLMWIVAIYGLMKAVDRMADRDCARGIVTACRYAPNASSTNE